MSFSLSRRFKEYVSLISRIATSSPCPGGWHIFNSSQAPLILLIALKKYFATLIVGAVFICLFLYPTVLTFFNYTPPIEGQLTTWHVHIVRAHGVPHLNVRLSDGTEKELYFPDALYSVQRGTIESHLLNKTQQASVQGCDGFVSVAPVKGLWPTRIFVWKLQCRDIYLSYDYIVNDYRSRLSRSHLWGAIFGLMALSIFIFVFLRETSVITDEMMRKINKPMW